MQKNNNMSARKGYKKPAPKSAGFAKRRSSDTGASANQFASKFVTKFHMKDFSRSFSSPSKSSYGSTASRSSYGATTSRPSSSYSSNGSSSYGPRSSYSSRGSSSYGSRGSYGTQSSYGSPSSYRTAGRSSGGQRFGGGSRFGSRGFGSRSGYSSRGPKPLKMDINKYINKISDKTKHELDEKNIKAVFKPKNTFKDFNIAEDIKTRIEKKGFINPSPIQDEAIPYILEGKDVVGIADTGTGKTAAFLIPLVNKVIENPKEEILIMAPTRELALQIQEELLVFIKNTKMYSVCCVGGAPIRRQIGELRYFNNFIIGTPGRLKDLGDKKYIDFSKFTNVVLDEADRMLDMGFIGDMRFIIGQMPKERQTLFFTATMSKEIEKIIHEFLNNPVKVSVKTGDTSKAVDQDVVRVHRGESKIQKLHELLVDKEEYNKVLVFGQTKSGVDRLTKELVDLGHKATAIHGEKNHYERQRALKAFKENQLDILVATDVAARGLDIPNVSHVINYELPMTYEDYVHRIGRTGRGGKLGKALTFVAV